jgi:hypothetical protein
MNKTECLNLIATGWQTLNTTLDHLSDAQKLDPRLESGWSVKDTIAHLMAWESELLRWLTRGNQGLDPEVPKFTDDYIHDFNARIFAENRNRSLIELQAAYRRTHDAVMGAVGALPDNLADARLKVWRNGEIPWNLIEGNTYGHYPEHIDMIRAAFEF